MFGTLPTVARDVEPWHRRWLPLVATATGSFMLALWSARDLPGSLRVRGGEADSLMNATGMTMLASLPSGWHSVRNPAPTRLDWTKGGAVSSSMGSLAGSSTNQLR